MPGKVLKSVDWLVDVPAREDIVGQGRVDSTKFSINYGGIVTEWDFRVFFNKNDSNQARVFLRSRLDQVNFDMQCTIIVWNQVDFKDGKMLSFLTKSSEWIKSQGDGGLLLIHEELFSPDGCKEVKDGKLHIALVIRERELPEYVILQARFAALDSDRVSRVLAMLTAADDSEIVKLKMSDGTILRAHKQIIGEKSQVFQRMFDIDMTEKSERAVNIIDYSGKVMEELLRFLNIGKVDFSMNIAIELYEAAKTYMVAELPEMCVTYLKSQLTSSNVGKILQFADLNGEDDLFDDCCDVIGSFIHSNVILRVMQTLFILTADQQNRVVAKLMEKLRGNSGIFQRVETQSSQ